MRYHRQLTILGSVAALAVSTAAYAGDTSNRQQLPVNPEYYSSANEPVSFSELAPAAGGVASHRPQLPTNPEYYSAANEPASLSELAPAAGGHEQASHRPQMPFNPEYQ